MSDAIKAILSALPADVQDAIVNVAGHATRALIEEGAVILRDGAASFDEPNLDEAHSDLARLLGRPVSVPERSALIGCVGALLASPALRAVYAS